MSLSQERPTNPAERFLKISKGSVVYYDKENEENIEVPTPFEFIVLDQVAAIKGWSDADESGFWSNEVRSVGRDSLTVRTSRGVKEVGIWRDIKGSSALAGAKYSASVYIAHKSKDGLVIANLSLTGAALKSWIEFTSKNNVNKVKVVLDSWQDGKKGSVTYKIPMFKAVEMPEDEKQEGIELDKKLQAYFKEYFDFTPSDHHTDLVEELDDVVTEVSDEPIDMSEIPF